MHDVSYPYGLELAVLWDRRRKVLLAQSKEQPYLKTGIKWHMDLVWMDRKNLNIDHIPVLKPVEEMN